MEPILKLQHVTKQYQDFVLSDINLEIPKGTIMGFIGENGAGKSTTIKAILNLISIDSGNIRIFDKDNIKYEKECKEDIGVVLSESMFPENMNMVKIDKVMNQIFKKWDSPLFFSYGNKFQLPNRKKIKEFSKGMKMKLAIACALSHHPKLLLLDEATSGLDPVIREEILDVFLDFIQDEEHSVFISSHITSDIEKIADYITFIHEGKILLSKAKDEMLDEYGILRATPEQFASLQKEDYISYRKSAYAIDVLVKNKEAMLRKMPAAVIDPANLEDILLYMVKGER